MAGGRSYEVRMSGGRLGSQIDPYLSSLQSSYYLSIGPSDSWSKIRPLRRTLAFSLTRSSSKYCHYAALSFRLSDDTQWESTMHKKITATYLECYSSPRKFET